MQGTDIEEDPCQSTAISLTMKSALNSDFLGRKKKRPQLGLAGNSRRMCIKYSFMLMYISMNIHHFSHLTLTCRALIEKRHTCN